MIRSPVIFRRGSMAMIFVFFFLAPAASLEGGENGIGGNVSARGEAERRIELSLRISEAKGNRIGRTYFRSLLRQSKRKPVRLDLPERHRLRTPRK